MIDEELDGVEQPELGIGGWVLLTIVAARPARPGARGGCGRASRARCAWCQLFSEPNAGSDAAAIATRGDARRRRVARHRPEGVDQRRADARRWGFATVRTDPTAPKHAGVTMMAIDMRADGVDRPAAARDHRRDAVQRGLLRRRVRARRRRRRRGRPGLAGRAGDAGQRAGVDRPEPRTCWPRRRRRPRAARRSLRRGRRTASSARSARSLVDEHAMSSLNLRAVTRAVAGSEPGPEGNLSKLLSSEHAQRLSGTRACASPGRPRLSGAEPHGQPQLPVRRCLTIAGGTSEIVRNVIAERILRMPRDPTCEVRPGSDDRRRDAAGSARAARLLLLHRPRRGDRVLRRQLRHAQLHGNARRGVRRRDPRVRPPDHQPDPVRLRHRADRARARRSRCRAGSNPHSRARPSTTRRAPGSRRSVWRSRTSRTATERLVGSGCEVRGTGVSPFDGARWTTVRDPTGVLLDVVEDRRCRRASRACGTCASAAPTSNASREWYEGIGFETLGHATVTDAAFLDRSLANGVGRRAHAEALRLRLPDEPFEALLFEWRSPPTHGRHVTEPNHAGMYRAALGVDDTRASYAAMSAAGWVFEREPTSVLLTGTPVPEMWISFLADPDGVALRARRTAPVRVPVSRPTTGRAAIAPGPPYARPMKLSTSLPLRGQHQAGDAPGPRPRVGRPRHGLGRGGVRLRRRQPAWATSRRRPRPWSSRAGILPIYTRTPTLLAMTAAGLDELSDGRFVLGLGASGPQVIEGFHGVPYDSPIAPHARDHRHLPAGVGARGAAHLRRVPPTRCRCRPSRAPGSASRSRSSPTRCARTSRLRRLAGREERRADRRGRRRLAPALLPARARRRRVRRVDSPPAQPSAPPTSARSTSRPAASSCIGEPDETKAALDTFARPMTALYVGGMGAKGRNFYNTLVQRYGYEAEAAEIQDLYLVRPEGRGGRGHPRRPARAARTCAARPAS